MNETLYNLTQHGYNRTDSFPSITGSTFTEDLWDVRNVTSPPDKASMPFSDIAMDTVSHDSIQTRSVLFTGISSTIQTHEQRKYGNLTDMQLQFLIVASLFIIVVILSLINLYIHLHYGDHRRGSNGDDGRIGGKASSGMGGSRGSGRSYTVKMKGTKSLFV